jgi:hypothetical protein
LLTQWGNLVAAKSPYSAGVAIFGGTAAYVVTWLVGVTSDPLACTYYVMAANVVMLLAVLSIRRG